MWCEYCMKFNVGENLLDMLIMMLHLLNEYTCIKFIRLIK